MALAPRPERLISLEGIETEDQIVHLEEAQDVVQENYDYQGVVNYVEDRFQKAKDARKSDEERWERAYRNYRGTYGPDVQFTEDEKSRVFLKITKTKVLAAYAQMTDVLLAGNKFPIGIDPTPVPSAVEEVVSVDSEPTPQGAPTKSSTVARPELKSLGSTAKALEGHEEKVTSGRTGKPTDIIFEPATQSARLMEKNIHDQLEESDAGKHLRAVCFEMSLLGHGVMKGPFVERKEYPKWSKSGDYEPEVKTVPKVSYVSVWNVYPDPDARSMNECDYFIERHKMRRSEVRDLKKNPTFRRKSIDMVLERGPNYQEESWENLIRENHVSSNDVNRYEVLEYWGMMDKEVAEEEADFEIPSELKDKDQFQVNIWVCNGVIIRMVLNPFTPNRIPYHAVPYEINPYSFFGVGIAENMDDTQTLMNGFMRMAVDNAALSGNVMFEVNEENLSPGQDMRVYPGKVWRRSGGAPGQAIFGTTIPNVSQELLNLFDKARQQADESTGMPSYAHGGTGVAGVGRTASGMSMLMGAAAQNIKAVVRNIDDYLLAPLGKAFFAFNMQFSFDEDYTNGDLEVIARGTESLMRNEIRSQRLLQFMQMTSNPQMAPMVRYDYILRELAASMDLDEEKILNDPRSAMLQAMLVRDYMEASGQGAAPQQGQQPGGAPPVSDPTGNGNGTIAPGNAPEPGAQGFTGQGGMTGAGAAATQQNAQPMG